MSQTELSFGDFRLLNSNEFLPLVTLSPYRKEFRPQIQRVDKTLLKNWWRFHFV